MKYYRIQQQQKQLETQLWATDWHAAKHELTHRASSSNTEWLELDTLHANHAPHDTHMHKAFTTKQTIAPRTTEKCL